MSYTNTILTGGELWKYIAIGISPATDLDILLRIQDALNQVKYKSPYQLAHGGYYYE